MTHTRSEIMSMTPEQVRMEIAQKNFVEIHRDELGLLLGKPSAEYPYFQLIPDYPHDIAAAWELEDEIEENVQFRYSGYLCSVIEQEKGSWCNAFDYAHATAEQRVRAYLMLMMESEK